MSRSSVAVTYKDEDGSRLPDALTEGAVLLLDLRRRGVVDGVGERLHIRRQGGFAGLDVWITLLLFFTTGTGWGLKRFWELCRPHALALAALAGRRKLVSPASLSRALDAVELELLRGVSSSLLAWDGALDGLLGHRAVQTYDAGGCAWHVFDLDPTVTTLRHRALPVGDDLPEPVRRSEHTGTPGHSGRKRGDIQFRRVTVQHTGSGVWLHAHLSPGNGEGVRDFERALDTVVETCARLGHPLERALMRMDGEYGNVPWFTACRERGLPFVTRLNRPKLYEDPDILRRLRTASWWRVPDSLSGPSRAAADLGTLVIEPGQHTRRPDGTAYGPVTVRVVASAFPRDVKANHGRVLDGWQVELFAVDLSERAWPAPDAIAAYFGRAAQENRFAQEDRELGLDRILSYHLPGQELATLVGLSLYNLRLLRGFELERPPDVRPVTQLRRPLPDERIAPSWPSDPVLCATLAELDWPALLTRWPGWVRDAASAEVRCEDGRPLALASVRPTEQAPGRTGLIFMRPKAGCEDCDARPACFHSDRDHAAKHAEFAAPTPIAERLRSRLAAIRKKRAPSGASPVMLDPGPYAVTDSLFLPATARQTFAAILDRATLRIHVEVPPPPAPKPRLVTTDAAARQHRRKTWKQKLQHNALPDDASVHIEVEASEALRSMLGQRPAAERETTSAHG